MGKEVTFVQSPSRENLCLLQNEFHCTVWGLSKLSQNLVPGYLLVKILSLSGR